MSWKANDLPAGIWICWCCRADAERLSVFPSGLAILIAISETLHIENMTLAGGALREGLIYGMVGKNRSCDVRERAAG